MKKFLLSTVIPAIALMAFNANATSLTVSGALTLSWKVTQQGTYANSTSTNHTSKATNVVSKYSGKTTSMTFSDVDLLELLTNSFKTNFPAGAKLATDGDGNIQVVDKTGTNVLLTNITSVLNINSVNDMESYSSSYTTTVAELSKALTNIVSHTNVVTSNSIPISTNITFTTNITTTSTNSVGTGTQTETQLMILTYNDSEMSTGDGTHTSFTIYGVRVSAYDSNSKDTTDKVSGNFSVQDACGTGTIRGVTSVISGSLNGSAKGTESDD